MARSTYIYLVKKPIKSGYKVIGAYTVKHEMLAEISSALSEHEYISVWRYRDGNLLENPTLMIEADVKEVLEELI